MMANEKQNAFVFYLRTLVYTWMALAVRVIALAPLACLFVFDDWKRALAVLCPVLVIFVVLPLRYSFAQAMTEQPRRFSFDTAFSFSRYGQKLKEGLVHILHVLKWGIPMAILLALGYYWYSEVDYLDMYLTVDELGNTCAQLFGMETANNFMLGVGAVMALFGLGVLIWMWGATRNSASRYLWAITVENGSKPHAEMRRRLKGRRLAQLAVAIINLILWVPFLCAAVCAAKSAASDLSTMLMMAITTGALPKMEIVGAAVPVAGAFAVLYLPLLPLRRWNTAAFALRKPRAKADKKVSA